MTREEFRQRRIALGLTQGFMARFLGAKDKQRVDSFERGLLEWPAHKLRQAEMILKPAVDTKEIYRAALFILIHACRLSKHAFMRKRISAAVMKRKKIGIEAFLDVFIDMIFKDVITEKFNKVGVGKILLGEDAAKMFKQATTPKKRKKRKNAKKRRSPTRVKKPLYVSDRQLRFRKTMEMKKAKAEASTSK